MTVRLCDLKCGDKGKIISLDGTMPRLSDFGFFCGATLECAVKSPLGDPSAFLVRGALIALRREQSENILVEVI